MLWSELKNWKMSPAHPCSASWHGKQTVPVCNRQLFSLASKYFNIISWQAKAESLAFSAQLHKRSWWKVNWETRGNPSLGWSQQQNSCWLLWPRIQQRGGDKGAICQKCLQWGSTVLFSLTTFKRGHVQKHAQVSFTFAFLPYNSEAATIWGHHVPAFSATGSLETGPICFPVPLLLGNAVPCTGTVKAPLEEGCSTGRGLLPAIFTCEIFLSRLWHSMAKSCWAACEQSCPWAHPTQWVVSFSHHLHNSHCREELLFHLDCRCREFGVVMPSQWLACLGLSFNVTVPGRSVELQVEKATLEIPETGYLVFNCP